jgi:hypothetical protein
MARHLLDDAAEDPLDVQRVLAPEEPVRVLDEVGHPAAAVRLADPRHAGVGVDLHQVPLEVPVDDRRLDVRDRDVVSGGTVGRVVREVPHA